MSFSCVAFPAIVQSAGSDFLSTNQENTRVRGVTKSYVICYTCPFLRSLSSCEQLLYSCLVEIFPTASPVTYLLTGIRLFVFNLLLLSLCGFFYPHLSWRDFSYKCFSNNIVTFVANYPKQQFIVSPVVLLFSSANWCEAFWSSGYINCDKCLAAKVSMYVCLYVCMYVCETNLLLMSEFVELRKRN